MYIWQKRCPDIDMSPQTEKCVSRALGTANIMLNCKQIMTKRSVIITTVLFPVTFYEYYSRNLLNNPTKHPFTLKSFQMTWMPLVCCPQLFSILQYFLVLSRQTVESIFMHFQILTNNRTGDQPCDHVQLEMWANAQPDGRPAEYRWRPLFNAAKFGWRPLLDAVQ